MLRDDLKSAMIDAMKAKEARKVSTLRLVLAAIKDRDIADRGKDRGEGDGDDDHITMQILMKMIKQRRDSIEAYEQGGRLELAEQERQEIEIIETFLPKQMSLDEISKAVDGILKDVGAEGLKDMGRAMAALKDKHSGCMDFSKASQIVKDRLTG